MGSHSLTRPSMAPWSPHKGLQAQLPSLEPVSVQFHTDAVVLAALHTHPAHSVAPSSPGGRSSGRWQCGTGPRSYRHTCACSPHQTGPEGSLGWWGGGRKEGGQKNSVLLGGLAGAGYALGTNASCVPVPTLPTKPPVLEPLHHVLSVSGSQHQAWPGG